MGSFNESTNDNRKLFESELHAIVSLIDEFRRHLTQEDMRKIVNNIMFMIDLEAVRNGKGENDVGGEPHTDTYDYLLRTLFPD